MHGDQGPVEKEGRDGGPLKLLTCRLDVERSILRFPSPLHASEGALRILPKGNWKSKVFLVGWYVWTVAALPRQSREKNPWQLSTYRVLTCRQKPTWSRFVAWWERSLIPDTHTDTHAHTHTHGIKAVWDPPGRPALARTWPPARIKLCFCLFSSSQT